MFAPMTEDPTPFQISALEGPKESYGLISRAGELVLPPEAEEIHFFFEGLAGIKRGGRWGFVDVAGREAIAPRYQLVRQFRDGLCAVNLGRWRYIDGTGAELAVPPMKYAGDFSEGLAAVANEKLKWGFVDREGALVIQHAFDDAGCFSEGLCAVKTRKGWGYIDRSGGWVIEPRFKRAWGMKRGRAQVVSTGRESSDAFAQLVGGYQDGGEFRGQWGIIDRSGSYLVAPRFKYSESAIGAASSVRRRALGPIDHSVLPPIVEGAAPLLDGHYLVKTKRGWGYVDAEGNEVMGGAYARAGEPAEGHALVEEAPGAGFRVISLKSRVMHAPRFTEGGGLDGVFHFADGLAPVAVSASTPLRWGYANHTGEMEIEPRWRHASPFERGLAQVVDGALAYIDRAGALIWPGSAGTAARKSDPSLQS